MVDSRASEGEHVAQLIGQSGLSIYDHIALTGPMFFDLLVLEDHLRRHLVGRDLAYPIRTRSMHGKSLVAAAMGYPVPNTFRKTKPRFPGQNLDVHVQKNNNLQIWNDEVDPFRRYALIRVDAAARITDVRVVTGESIALLDHTGTLTQKYQASRQASFSGSRLVSRADTPQFLRAFQPAANTTPLTSASPTERPIPGEVLTIARVYELLSGLVGQQLPIVGLDQERNRGAELHRLVCQALGYRKYADTGQFPDVLGQALEVKLQTSRTIDLGLVVPDSQAPAAAVGGDIRHCDVRYAIFYASALASGMVELSAVVVTTGTDFFREFQQFEGMIRNRKRQIHLPSGFFRQTEN